MGFVVDTCSNQMNNPVLPDVLSEVGPPGRLEPVADLAGVHALLLQVDLLHVRLQVPLVGRREGASAAGVNPPANTMDIIFIGKTNGLSYVPAISTPLRRPRDPGCVGPVTVLELSLRQKVNK